MSYKPKHYVDRYKDKLKSFMEDSDAIIALKTNNFERLYEIWIERYCEYNYAYTNVLTALLLESGIDILSGQKKVIPLQFCILDIKEIVIPENIKLIDQSAFEQCNMLKKVTLNEGLERIEERSFAGSNMESISIPASVESIGINAFFGCPIKTLVFNRSMKEIADCCDYIDIPNDLSAIIKYLGLAKQERAGVIQVYFKG